FFDFSTAVDELDVSAWPAGAWISSPPVLPSARQANQAGFVSPGLIWSTGGYNGAALAEHLARGNGVGCATPTPTATATFTPTATATSTPTPTPTPTCPTGAYNYVTSTTTGNTIVPGTTDTNNHCDDCTTAINFPFPVSFYGTSYNGGVVGSNG